MLHCRDTASAPIVQLLPLHSMPAHLQTECPLIHSAADEALHDPEPSDVLNCLSHSIALHESLLADDARKLRGAGAKQTSSEVEPDNNAADVIVAATCICLICQFLGSLLGILQQQRLYSFQ